MAELRTLHILFLGTAVAWRPYPAADLNSTLCYHRIHIPEKALAIAELPVVPACPLAMGVGLWARAAVAGNNIAVALAALKQTLFVEFRKRNSAASDSQPQEL
jgi:hypothetical protein